MEEMKQAIRTTYFTKGEDVIQKNIAAVDAGAEGAFEFEIPADWATAQEQPQEGCGKMRTVQPLRSGLSPCGDPPLPPHGGGAGERTGGL